jgi:hypothetical protein
VIDALQRFDQLLAEKTALQDPGPGWPAFKAGCEALALGKSTGFLLQWTEKGAKKKQGTRFRRERNYDCNVEAQI